MRTLNQFSQFEDATYLEVNEEHLARFLAAIERRIALDNAGAEALVFGEDNKKMRAATAYASGSPAS